MVPRHGNDDEAGHRRVELATECNCRFNDPAGADFSTAKQPQALRFEHDPEFFVNDLLPRWRVQRQSFEETATFSNYFNWKSLCKIFSDFLVPRVEV